MTKDDNIVNINKRQISEKTLMHPCYTCSGKQYARIHLPIAPKCNIQCNYCVRKYDCPNESRPGVTTEILSPQEAFEKYMDLGCQVIHTASALDIVETFMKRQLAIYGGIEE